MKPEIENCLKRLLDRPFDEQPLDELSALLEGDEGRRVETLAVLDRNIGQHRQKGNPVVAVRLLDMKLGALSDDDDKAEALLLKGKVYEEELLDQEAALEAYEQVLELRDDDDLEDQVEHLEFVADNVEAVVAKWVDEAEAASESTVATNLYCTAAEALWRSGAESPDIEGFLKKSLESEPRNWRSARHLERLYSESERYDALAGLLEQRFEIAATRSERLAILLRLGQVQVDHLSAPDKAAEYFKKVIDIDPNNAVASDFLVDALEAASDWASLVEVYESVLRSRPQQDKEVATLVRVGLLFQRHLDDAVKAESYFRRVRKYNPTHPALLDFYREHYRQTAEPAKLLTLLDAAQRMESDTEKRVVLAREVADLAETEVGKVDKAIDIWKGIQRMDPDNAEAKSALKRLYRNSTPPKWNALRELLREELESLPDEKVDEKIQLLMEIVEIYRDNLRLDVMVINTYNAILALKPDHEPALAALTEKYESMGRWNDLIGLLLKCKDVEEDPQAQVAILHRVASLWVDKFGNHSQAIKPLEEILAIDPVEADALEKLRLIHSKRRNWRELVEISRREAEHVEGDRRRELFREIAQLATSRLSDPNEGIQVWNRLLEDDPSDAEALDELAKLYRKVKRWPALAEVLERTVRISGADAEVTLKLQTELGDIYTSKLDAVDNAIGTWQQVLSLQPDSRKARQVLRDLYVRQERWDDLEQLFAERGDYARLADTLGSAADRSDDPDLKVALFTRVGEVQRDNLTNPDKAIRFFERAREISPTDLSVANALADLYRQGEKWSNLLEIIQVLLDYAEDNAARLELLAEIRQLCELRLHSKAQAFAWCAQAFSLDPDDLDLRNELERLAGEAGEWEELVAIYTDRVAEIDDAEARAELLRKLATLSEDQLGRPEDAEVFFRELLELYPEDMDALRSLQRVYTEAGRWTKLVDIYRRRVDLEAEVEIKVDLLFRVAAIQEENLEDTAAAVDSLDSVVGLQPDNLEAYETLARLHEYEQLWDRLVDVLTRKLDLVSDDADRVAALHRLAETLQVKLEDHPRAVDYFAQVLSLDSSYEPTVNALERYFILEEGNEGEVARLLEPVYQANEQWAKLVQALEVMLQDEEDNQARISLFKRLMVLERDNLERPQAAFAAGSELMRLNPEDLTTREELVVLAEELGELEALVDLYRESLDNLGEYGDPALELALNWELAGVLDDRMAQPEDAEEYLRRVVEVEPGHRSAFDMLERILRDLDKYEELRDLLQRRKELEPDADARRDVLLQICSLNEDFLDDADSAILAYEEVLELVPDHGVALKALERHYTDAERWSDLLELLQREMSYVDDDDGLNDLKYRQAALMAHHLEDLSGAVDLLEEVVGMSPGLDAPVALLEELMDDADLRGRIAETLESVYNRREDYEDLVRILLTRRSLADGSMEAVDFLCRAAALQEEKLADPVNAFECYREAMTLEPGALKIHESVQRLVTEMETWDEAAEAWQAAFEAADPNDVALRARLQMKLAVVFDDKLMDTDQAREAYELLLELDPSDLETALPAAVALTRLYEGAGMWEPLIDVLRRQLAWEQEPDKREDLLVKICKIQEDVLGEVDAAIDTFRELLQENPSSAEALDSLERLFLQTEQWQDLVDILRRRVEMAESAEERQDLWFRIAGLYQEQLEDTDQAISSYLTVLDEMPDDLDAIRSLARIYRDEERWADLLDMLERELALEQADAEERVDLIFRIATIHHRNLMDLAVAVGRYRQVLELAPDHDGARQALEEMLDDDSFKLDAAALLAPVYEAESNWEALIGIYELQAAEAAIPDKVRLLCQVARLCEDGLDDTDRAFDAYRRVVKEATGEPDFLGHVDQFQRIARNLDRWEEFVDVLEDVVLDVMDPESQRVLYLNSAVVSRDHLTDLERSKRLYQAVLDSDPEHREALGALDALYDVLEEWDPLLEILQRRAELADDESDRREFYRRCAVLCRDRLENPDEAIVNFERVLEMFPRDDNGIAALDELYQTTERWADLAALLERRLEWEDEAEVQVELHFRLGQVRAVELEESALAVGSFHEVLKLESNHTDAIAALEGYLDDMDLQVEAAHIIEPIFVDQMEWEKLVRVLRIRLDAGDETESRLSLLTRIATLYEEQLDDLDRSFVWYGKVFLEQPSDPAIRDQLLRLTSALENWQDLAEVLASFLDNTMDDDETTRDVGILLGNIYDEQLQDVHSAASCFGRALAADRGDDEAFGLLEHLLTRNDRWEDLLVLYREMADAIMDHEPHRELLLKICRVWEEALFDLDEAIDAYRAVLDHSDNDVEAVSALDRLYSETERWQDLAELLTRQCDFVEAEAEIVDLKYRIGSINEEKLSDLHAAVDHYEDVLNRDPAHEAAVEALERIMDDQDQRFRVAQILEQIYQNRGDWANLVRCYEAQLEFIDDKVRKVELLREIARLQEEVGSDFEAAFDAFRRAFAEEFGDPDLLENLERLTAYLENWEELVDVLKKGVEGTYDYELQATIHGKIAVLLEDQLDDQNEAVESWRKVMAAREEDEQAVDALIRLLGDLERFDELIEVLQRKAEFTSDPEEQKATYLRIAEIYENMLMEPGRATETYRQILVVDAEDLEALDALERLYTAAEEWMELIAIYQRKTELAADESDRRELQLAVAQVYEEQLNDGFEAINAYKNLLMDEPTDGVILDALDRLYTNEELHADLLDVLETKIEQAADVEQRIELLFRAGSILEQQIGDLDGAIDRYRRVLDEDRNHENARAALEALVRGESHREVVAEVLENLYQATAEVDPLIEVLELRLEAMADPPSRRELLLRIAQLHEEARDDSEAAFEALARALADNPGDEHVQQELDRLAGMVGNFAQLVEVYEDQLDNIYDAELSRFLHLKLAKLLEEVLGDFDGAERHYRATLDFEGDPLEPLQALDNILTHQEKWDDLLEVLERELDAAMDPSEQANLLYRMGEIKVREHEDVDGGFGAFRDALERDPQHELAQEDIERLLSHEDFRVRVLEVLEPIAEDGGNHSKLVELLELRLTTVGEASERTAVLERIAQIQEESLEAPDMALSALGRAMAEEPGNESVLDRVEELAAGLNAFDEVVQIAAQLLEGEISGDAAVVVGLRAAQWYGAQLAEVEQAEACLKRVLDFDPDCADALKELEKIYRVGSEFADLAAVLWRRAEGLYDPETKRPLLAEVAQLREDALEDAVGAVEAWQGILELDAEDAEALDALARLYEEQQSWHDFLDILERKVTMTQDPEAQVALKHRMGQVLAMELEDATRAIDAYKDVLEIVHDDREALAQLELIYTALEEWDEVREVLMRRLEVEEPAERVATYFQLAELCATQLEETDDAVGYYHEILNLDPANLDAVAQLETLLRHAERWYDLVEVLKRHAEICGAEGDAEAEVEQLVEASRIWSDQLANSEAAAEMLEAILEKDPENVQALAGLARIYEAMEDWDRCQDVLQRAAALNPEPREAAELEFRMGRIKAQQGGDEAEAVACYRRALELNGAHTEALAALEEYARGADDWATVAELLEVKVNQVSQAERLAVLMELGGICSDKLAQPDASVGYLEMARELDPENPEVLAPLADAYYEAEQYDEAEPLLEALIKKSVRGRRKELARYTYRMGTISEQRGNADDARDQFEKAYKLDSTFGPTLVALGRVYLALEDWAGARRIYRSMLLQNIDQKAGISKDDIFYHLGLAHMNLDETPKALSMFERGLEVNPDHDGLKAALEDAKS